VPTKRDAWRQVRLAVNSFGERTTVDHVGACGCSEAKIAEARKRLAK
jgi:hypothetical protein